MHVVRFANDAWVVPASGLHSVQKNSARSAGRIGRWRRSRFGTSRRCGQAHILLALAEFCRARRSAVEVVDGGDTGATRGLEIARDSLGIAQHPQHVAAGDLGEVFVGPAEVGERCEDLRV